MEVTLRSITPDAEEQLVEIARVSSSREDKTAEPDKLINYLIKHSHWSPFEHGFISMKIVTSKAIAIQLLRHRSFTFQEFSQRYAKVTDMEPIELRGQAEKNRQSSTDVIGHNKIQDEQGNWSHVTMDVMVSGHLKATDELYNKLLDAGVAKECARFILPMTTQTTLYMSGPIRSWIHMVNLRDDSHAQKEAQLIAKEMKRIFIRELPIVSKALGWEV